MVCIRAFDTLHTVSKGFPLGRKLGVARRPFESAPAASTRVQVALCDARKLDAAVAADFLRARRVLSRVELYEVQELVGFTWNESRIDDKAIM